MNDWVGRFAYKSQYRHNSADIGAYDHWSGHFFVPSSCIGSGYWEWRSVLFVAGRTALL